MSIFSNLAVIILAAGKGTRMKSDKAKVLHEVCSLPMVHHVLNAVQPLNPQQIITIVGHQRNKVVATLAAYDTLAVTQEEQLGTGHAVLVAEQSVAPSCKSVMILCGDTPLIRPETLQELFTVHCQNDATLTLMTAILEDPTNYGRIISGEDGQIKEIVEQKDGSPEQLQIHEINAGIYCVNRDFLFTALKEVGTDNSQGEVYLTDIIEIAVKSGKRVQKYVTPHAHDVLGVNSRVELSAAHQELAHRRNKEIMLQGVTINAPETVFISPEAQVGKDCLLMAGVHIQGNSTIGEHCTLHQGVILTNCKIGKNVHIGAYSVLDNVTLPDGAILSPLSVDA